MLRINHLTLPILSPVFTTVLTLFNFLPFWIWSRRPPRAPEGGGLKVGEAGAEGAEGAEGAAGAVGAAGASGTAGAAGAAESGAGDAALALGEGEDVAGTVGAGAAAAFGGDAALFSCLASATAGALTCVSGLPDDLPEQQSAMARFQLSRSSVVSHAKMIVLLSPADSVNWKAFPCLPPSDTSTSVTDELDTSDMEPRA